MAPQPNIRAAILPMSGGIKIIFRPGQVGSGLGPPTLLSMNLKSAKVKFKETIQEMTEKKILPSY